MQLHNRKMLNFLVISLLMLAVKGKLAYKGATNQTAQLRIINGQNVKIEDYPHQVSVQTSLGHLCGGSIISETHVLTSAKCVKFISNKLTVRAGSAFHSYGGSEHNVKHIDIHEDWAGIADIAILTIKEPFVFDVTRKPLSMFSINDIPKPFGMTGKVAGWGLTTENGAVISDQLQAINVTILYLSSCNYNYKNTTIGKIVDGQLCASGALKSADPCYGDEGDALLFYGRQLGIYSKSLGCARKNYPGIYTDVRYFDNWINVKLIDGCNI